MRQYAFFPTPADAVVVLASDNGLSFTPHDGMVGTRPAQIFDLPDTLPEGWGARLTISRADYSTITMRGRLYLKRDAPYAELEVDDVTLPPSSAFGPLPAVPTREQVCGINISLQGLTVNTQQFGNIAWFELWLQCCSLRADREACYVAKRATDHDRHAIVEFRRGGAVYDEYPFQGFISPDFESNPALFCDLIAEIIIVGGLIPIIVYDGDNGDNPVDGHPNAMRQLPILYNTLKHSKYGDLNPYVLKARFWDGVFYGSSPENIRDFGTYFRQIDPSGYLAIEHNPGHIPVGEGGNDYQPGGRMDAYDVVVSEFSTGKVPHDDTTFQIVGRLNRPYNRPADQPAGDDPSPPFYLVDSPRGPRYYCAFEFGDPAGIYWFLRGWTPLSVVLTERQYNRNLGCRYTG